MTMVMMMIFLLLLLLLYKSEMYKVNLGLNQLKKRIKNIVKEGRVGWVVGCVWEEI